MSTLKIEHCEAKNDSKGYEIYALVLRFLRFTSAKNKSGCPQAAANSSRQ